MARIRYAVDDWSACAWYRAHVPGMALQSAGHEVVLDRNITPADVGSFDVVVFQRQWRREAVEAMQRAKSLGMTVVYELDDDLWNISPSNPAYDAWSRPDIRGAAETMLREADAVTTTTQPLAKLLRRFNGNVHVLANMLPRDHWPAEPPDRSERDMVTVGWAGSRSRERDLREVAGVAEQIVDRYSNVRFLVGGSNASLFKPHERIETLPVAKIERYPHDVLALFDIGLAPLSDDQFNMAKSDLKFIEYAWMGIATVASKVGPYERAIEPGETGLLARNPKDWLKQIRRLVEDPDLRGHIARNARRVAEGRVMEDHVDLWERAYGITRPGE